MAADPTTTPPPVYMTGTPPTDSPGTMDHHEKGRFRRAAYQATRMWPGPIGEVISRELLVIDEFGWRLGGLSFGMQLVQAVEQAMQPETVDVHSSVRGGFPVQSEAKPA